MKIWEKGVGCFEKNVVNNGFNFVFWGVGWILRLVIFEVLVVKILVEKKNEKFFSLKGGFFGLSGTREGFLGGRLRSFFSEKRCQNFGVFSAFWLKRMLQGDCGK